MWKSPNISPASPCLHEFQNILLIRTGRMGDICHALPTLSALRQRFPHAALSWLVDQPFAALLQNHPANVALIPTRYTVFAAAPQNPRATFLPVALARQLRRQRFDLVIDLHGFFPSAALAALSGAPMRLGFADAREGAPLFYTHTLQPPAPLHAVQRFLLLAQALGAPATDQFGLRLSPADCAAAAAHLAHAGLAPQEPYIIVAPRTTRRKKDWAPRRFAELIRRLHTDLGLRCVLLGGPSDEPACRRIAAAAASHALTLTGAPLRISLAALAMARLVIANDSGPLHAAVALGRPVVALFGITDPRRYGPYQNPQSVVRNPAHCPACRHADRHPSLTPWHPFGHRCLETLAVAPVYAKVLQTLADHPPPPNPAPGATPTAAPAPASPAAPKTPTPAAALTETSP